MLELFPEGFEEIGGDGGSLELAAYTNAAGEERIWQAFGGAASSDVEEDWQDRWRQFHKPVRVGSLWIGPPWEQPDPDALAVVIDPGRAFGTGGHPTTQLCLQLLEGEERGSVLDVGCGSGVLSIAAAKLGFAPVRAFDFDPQAVEATERNAADNGVTVAVEQADLREDDLPDRPTSRSRTSPPRPSSHSGRGSARDARSRPATSSPTSPSWTATAASAASSRAAGRRICTSVSRFSARWRASPFVFSAARCRRPTPRRCASGSSATATTRSKAPATSPS